MLHEINFKVRKGEAYLYLWTYVCRWRAGTATQQQKDNQIVFRTLKETAYLLIRF
jgi:hypothetical protein